MESLWSQSVSEQQPLYALPIDNSQNPVICLGRPSRSLAPDLNATPYKGVSANKILKGLHGIF